MLKQEKKITALSSKLSEKFLKDKIFKAQQSLELPRRLTNYTFDTFRETSDNSNVRSICLEYASKPDISGGLIMLGNVGTGKTHLAVAICQELVNKGVICKLTTVNKIVRDIRSCWGKEGDKTENEIVQKYTNIELLVIDEIGSQYGTDSEKIIINEIINNRYEELLPTIVIGNLSVSELKKTLGERVVDRISHGGHILLFQWKSLRGRK